MESVRVVGVQIIYSISRPWTSHLDATLREWSGVAFGNGLFVAVAGNGGGPMRSSDRVTRTSGVNSGEWRSICFGNGRFVALADATYTTTHVMTSTNGTSWTTATVSARNAWNSVVFGNGKFVAVAWTS